MNKKQYLLPPLRPVTAKTCSLTHEGKNKNNSPSIFLSLSFFPLCLESFLTFRIGPTPVGLPMRENGAEYPGQTGYQTPLH